MVFYIDTYILVNFCMNLLIIQTTKKITKYRISILQMIIFSLLTTIFSLLFLCKNVNLQLYLLINIISTITLLLVIFKPKSIFEAVRINVIYISVTFAAGGCSYMIINIFSDNIFLVLLPTSVFTYTIISYASELLKKYHNTNSLTHSLIVYLGTKTIKTYCFYDTGNNLKDPISQLPVAVINVDVLETFFPNELITKLKANINTTDIFASYCKKFKLKLIPYHTVSGDGFMLGFSPDKTLLDNREINCIIGITMAKTLVDNKKCAIINPLLITWRRDTYGN